MEGAGLGLAVIAEVRTLITMIEARIVTIHHGLATFQRLTDDLKTLIRQIEAIESHLGSAPATVPTRIRTVFLEKVSSVRDILKSCFSTLEKDCSKAFPETGSSAKAKVKSFLRRAVRASALSDTMNAIQSQVHGASTQLDIVLSTLVTEQNIQERHDVVLTKLGVMRVDGTKDEVYRVGASTPELPQGTTLNFDAKDEEVSAAVGVCTSAHGVVGMAGVGKTTALQGLAFDKDIRSRFPDGVHYIALGQGATFLNARGELVKIMWLSGASISAVVVKDSSSLREAVDFAVGWFDKKICLFLVDDLWPTDDCPTEFLKDLRQLLRCHSASRMAITTRSTVIALHAGHPVDFAPRLSLGAVSVSIFMRHAKQDATVKAHDEHAGDLRRSIATILTICAGLPIALAVAGSTVAVLTTERGDFESSCDAYAVQLGKKRDELGEEQGPDGASLNAGILLSLKVLEAEFAKLKTRHRLPAALTISDLYTSLCVLRHQAWVPASVLGRMWNVVEDVALDVAVLLNRLSLCKVTFREHAQGIEKEGGLMLHDLHLDFCKRQAATLKTTSVWHTRLLDGYLVPVSSTAGGSLLADQDDSLEHTLLTYASRPWWVVPDDGYIHADVSRHLVSANLALELSALVLDARWAHARAVNGGILALKSDFECLLTLDGDILPHRVSQSIELVCKAIHLSWGRVTEGPRSFQFHMCGRLFHLRKDNAIVDSYLKGTEARTPLPYLVPVNPFFPDPRSAQVMEIPVGSGCDAVDCSPCGRYLAAGAVQAVVVADASTGEILKRLEGHSNVVSCVSFASGSKKIVSGSVDSSVAVWEWETSESPAQVFKGHSRRVTGIAVSSDAAKIYSCSYDRTLMIWDARTGAQVGEFTQPSMVSSVAVSNDDRSVAIGLENGTMKVLDCCTGDTIFDCADAHEDDVCSVAFSANGRRLATGSDDRTVRVWDTETWTSIGKPFQGHTSWVPCATCSPDGRQIASGSFDGTVRLWDASTGRNIWTSSNMRAMVTSVAFTPDEGKIICGSLDGTIRVWDTGVEAYGNEVEYGHSAPVFTVALSHDGLRVASGSEDGTVRLWDSRTGNQIGRPLVGHTRGVLCVSFSPDGRQVVSGSDDRTVRLWDAETFSQVGEPFEGYTDIVSCVSFSSDGLRIVSGSADKTVRLWDTGSGKQIGDALEGHTGYVMAVSESCDGCYVVSRDWNRVVIIWDRSNRTIVWKSKQRQGNSQGGSSTKHDSDTAYELADEEAESIIRSCGLDAPRLWPDSFPAYSGEVYIRDNAAYANVPTEDTLLASIPSHVRTWRYDEVAKVFVAGLESGAVAICTLKF